VLGEQGKIEEIEKLTDEIERLKRTKDDLIILAENPVLAQKQMKVCDICGSMQAINDTEVRNANHLDGKVHKGFALLRKEIDVLTKRRDMLNLILRDEKRQEKSSRSPRRRSPRSRTPDRRDRLEKERGLRDERKEDLSRNDRNQRTGSRSRGRREKEKEKEKDRKKEKEDKKKGKSKKDKQKRSRSESSSRERSRSRDKKKDSSNKERGKDKQKKEKTKKAKHRRSPNSSVESGELAR
jgi:hypothetical protein